MLNLAQLNGPLWTPLNLGVKPLLIADPAQAAWSTNNFSALKNTGTWGGSIVADAGTVTRTVHDLNGYDVFTFSGSNSLKLASQNWSGNWCVFAVWSGSPSAVTGGLCGQGWNDGTGHVCYGQLSGGGSTPTGDSWSTGATLMFSADNSGVHNITADCMTNGAGNSNYNMICLQVGTSHFAQINGSNALTAGFDTPTNPLTAHDVYIGQSGFNSEFLVGKVAYLAMLQNPTAAEIDKLNGWAAWRFKLQGLLPANHPYKGRAPRAEYHRRPSGLYVPDQMAA